MSTDIVNENSFAHIIDRWLKAEQRGERFPVDFDVAWKIAGYATKASAKRQLTHFIKGVEFSSEMLKNGQVGRSSDLITMTCDTFKHFCLLAKTDQGRNTRQYFIEAEKKWKLVETHFPQVSENIESLRLALEIEKQRNRGRELDNSMLALHGVAAVLAVRGQSDQIIEVDRPVLEVIDERCGDRRRGMTLKQINDYLLKTTGDNFKNGSVLKKYLEQKAPELIDQVQRPINQDWVHEDNINEVIKLLKNRPKQMLLGE